MRIARVLGTITMTRRLDQLKHGQWLIVEALDRDALAGLESAAKRKAPMPESLVVFDQSGAGVGQLIAVSEGREACVPFEPDRVPIDTYAAAILDHVSFDRGETP